jgi:hypothetical protein
LALKPDLSLSAAEIPSYQFQPIAQSDRITMYCQRAGKQQNHYNYKMFHFPPPVRKRVTGLGACARTTINPNLLQINRIDLHRLAVHRSRDTHSDLF